MVSSSASSTCRIDWRPSRWLPRVLRLIGLLAGLSLLLSALPASLRSPLAALAAAEGWRLARRERRRPPLSLSATGAILRIMNGGEEGPVLHAPRLREQGPLTLLCATLPGGRRLRLAWWPDTLDAAGRRQLRLAVAAMSRHDPILPAVAA
ncbi:MAG: hypothetical protein K0M64_07645 [Rhizobium sp.]|nr:hypothetical protein [Rhizobium sp.]